MSLKPLNWMKTLIMTMSYWHLNTQWPKWQPLRISYSRGQLLVGSLTSAGGPQVSTYPCTCRFCGLSRKNVYQKHQKCKKLNAILYRSFISFFQANETSNEVKICWWWKKVIFWMFVLHGGKWINCKYVMEFTSWSIDNSIVVYCIYRKGTY